MVSRSISLEPRFSSPLLRVENRKKLHIDSVSPTKTFNSQRDRYLKKEKKKAPGFFCVRRESFFLFYFILFSLYFSFPGRKRTFSETTPLFPLPTFNRDRFHEKCILVIEAVISLWRKQFWDEQKINYLQHRDMILIYLCRLPFNSCAE